MTRTTWRSLFVTIFVLSLIYFDLTNGQERPRKKAPSRRSCSMWTQRVWSVCYITPKCNPKSSCPAFPNAECKKVRDCNSCREVWLVDGEQVNCEACPPGVPQQSCHFPACKAVQCDDPEFKDKPCRSNVCGGCFAEFLFGKNDWRECPNARYIEPNGTSETRLIPRQPEIQSNSVQRATFNRAASRPDRGRQGLRERFGLRGPTNRPRDRSAGPGDVPEFTSCPSSSPEVPCPRTLCSNSTCPSFPDATCVIDACGVCHVDWLVGRRIVNCNQAPLKKCPRGVRPFTNCQACSLGYCELYPDAQCRVDHCLKCKAEYFVDNRPVECRPPLELTKRCPNPAHRRYVCPKEICRFEVCPNNHRVYCTIDNCGGCRAVYKYKWINEVTTCNGYWTRFEEDTAKLGYVYNGTQEELPANNEPIPAGTHVNRGGNVDQASVASTAGETLRQQNAELERLERIILQEQLEMMSRSHIGNDPHAGHNHGPIQNRPIDRTDPHAGHNHRPIQNRPIDRTDTHAGHNHGPVQNRHSFRIDLHAGHGHAAERDQMQNNAIGGTDPHNRHGHESTQNQFLDSPPDIIDSHVSGGQNNQIHNRPIVGIDPHAGHGHETVQEQFIDVPQRAIDSHASHGHESLQTRPVDHRIDQQNEHGQNQETLRTGVHDGDTHTVNHHTNTVQDTHSNTQVNTPRRHIEPEFSGVPVHIGGHEGHGHDQPTESLTTDRLIGTQSSRRTQDRRWQQNQSNRQRSIGDQAHVQSGNRRAVVDQVQSQHTQSNINTAEQHSQMDRQRGGFINQAQAENRAPHRDPVRDLPVQNVIVNRDVTSQDQIHQSEFQGIQGGDNQGIPIPSIRRRPAGTSQQFSSQASSDTQISETRQQRPTDRLTQLETRNSGTDISQRSQRSDLDRRQHPPVSQRNGPIVSSNQNTAPQEPVLTVQPGVPSFQQPESPLPTNTEELNIFHSLNDFPISMNLADFWSMAREWTRFSQQRRAAQQP